jgi:anti-sigma B factor antagonist
MKVRQHIEQDLVVLEPVGEVDIYTVGGLRAALAECLETGQLQIVVDLAGVTFMDSSGLGVLAGGLKKVRPAGGSLWLVGPSRMLRRMLESTGLSKVVDVYDSVDELVAARVTESVD